jgi:hypothetical protein
MKKTLLFLLIFGVYCLIFAVSTKADTINNLTIIKSGTGSGTVFEGNQLEMGSVINCGNNCSAPFMQGVNVTLTAMPDASSVFSSWTGCGVTSAEMTNPTCTIQVTGTTNITATFNVKPNLGVDLKIDDFVVGPVLGNANLGDVAVYFSNPGVGSFMIKMYDKNSGKSYYASVGNNVQHNADFMLCPGSYDAVFTIDSNNNIVESNENNNDFKRVFTVNGDASACSSNQDLVVTPGTANITADNKGVVYWTTNINATCGIDYSINSNLSDKTSANGILIQAGSSNNDGQFHFWASPNLTPNTDYFYRIICTTADGQNVTSDIKLLPKYVLPNLKVTNFKYSNGNINDQNISTQVEFDLVNADNRTADFYLVAWDNTTNYPLESTQFQPNQYNLAPNQTVHVYLINAKNISHLAAGLNSLTIKEVSLDSQTVYNSQDFTFTTSSNNQSVIPVTTDITTINSNASQLYNGETDSILAQLNELRNIVKEQETKIKYLESLTKDAQQVSQAALDAINNFIAYGVDQNSKLLGAGQRAAVVNSFKAAFDKLPTTQIDFTDVVKIANGRWPSQKSVDAENAAKEQFQKIYLRAPNSNNVNDNAAITIMAYGLQQQARNRNLKSETTGIKTFKYIYHRLPSSTEDWNIVAAITYSGAKR